MFKKFKDKIAEEVKSSPQRIQQFAQAAQAAVTSASSSISDISNNDLFSIGDDETPQNSPHRPPTKSRTSGFQDVSLVGSSSPLRSEDSLSLSNHSQDRAAIYPPPSSAGRLRKLSDCSNASDVSFRLPSYESSGSMYHLQSDLDVSESEMENSISIPSQLEKVSKEQLFAAYRRSNEKYNKYRGRYTDLARHYRNLERENAKARAVLVETQDKALRRISELREQCTLEQSAKAHLESALRMELDERSLKIESLNTKIKLLQSYDGQTTETAQTNSIPEPSIGVSSDKLPNESIPNNGEALSTDQLEPLIDFTSDSKDSTEVKQHALEELEKKHSADLLRLNDKLQKLEQLLVKCKDTIKTHKEKNSQLTTELQIASTQLEKKKTDIEQLESKVSELENIKVQLSNSRDLEKNLREELDSFEKKKANDILLIKKDLDVAKLEIASLSGKLDVLNKREEENVISLAENKLSVHKELESKENEIKILKENIKSTNAKLKSNEAVIDNLKIEVKDLETERLKMSEQLVNFDAAKSQISNLEGSLNELRSQNASVEGKCSGLSENIKCTELQLKQEVSEKLAVIDRNNFLEGRNKHLADENAKKNKQIADLEKELIDISKNTDAQSDLATKYQDLLKEKSNIKTEFETLLGSKESLENELNEVNSKFHGLETKLNQVSQENECLKLELNEFTLQVENLQREKNEIINLHKNTSEELDNLKSKYSKSTNELSAKATNLEQQLTNASQSNETKESIQRLHDEMKQKMESKENELKKTYENTVSEYEKLKIMYKDMSNNQSENQKISANYEELKVSYRILNDKQAEYEEDLRKYEGLKHSYEELEKKQTEYQEKLTRFEELENICKTLNDKITSNIEAHTAEAEILKNECKNVMEEKTKSEQKIAALEKENVQTKARTEALVADIKLLQSEITAVQESHSHIVSQKNLIEEKISLMEKSDSNKKIEIDEAMSRHILANENLQKKSAELQSKIEELISEKNQLANSLKEMQLVNEANEIKLKDHSDNSEFWNIKLSNILDENNILQEKCNILKQEKESVVKKIGSLEQKIREFEKMKNQFEESKLETEFLNMRVSQLEADFSQASSDKNKYITEKESLQKELAQMTNSKKTEIESLKEDLAKMKGDIKMLQEEKSSLQTQKEKEYAEKSRLISQLQSYEEKIKNHDQLEIEKKNLESRLSEVQDKYKNAESSTNEELSALQEANSDLRSKCEKLELRCTDYENLTQSFAAVEAERERMIVKIKVLEKIESEHNTMLEELHTMKSEKNKLHADIEGLQAHLTKVSKDNSQLNDRIRELEANGEVMQINYQHNLGSAPPGSDNSNMQSQIAKLSEANTQLLEDLKTNENLSSRILDLERQNSILIEEKLELQDQINSSMDRHDRIAVGVTTNSDNDYEINSLRNQLRDVINEKMDIEGRLADVELMSRSGDSNLKALEQKNEKLRLTNDKLERRLDEALVSLNHIRTMEENTELEYLRNILYEYLTGPSNNNMVLAKVLAAVVKFDQRQTQLVLEREKEKQGVLGQLGLL